MRVADLPHTSVAIRVGGERLTEYQTEVVTCETGSASVCFVEAVPDVEFDVTLSLHPGLKRDPRMKPERNHYLLFTVYLDGNYAASHILSQKKYVTSRGSKDRLSSVVQSVKGTHTKRKFKFTELETSRLSSESIVCIVYSVLIDATADARPQNAQRHEFTQLGEVKVEILRCGRSGSLAVPSDGAVSISNAAVPEKCLK